MLLYQHGKAASAEAAAQKYLREACIDADAAMCDADAAHFRQKAGSLMQHRGLMTTEKYGGIARRPKLASKRSPQGNGHSSWIHIMNVADAARCVCEIADAAIATPRNTRTVYST